MLTSEIDQPSKPPAPRTDQRIGQSKRRSLPKKRRAVETVDDFENLFTNLTKPTKRFGVGLLLALANRTGNQGNLHVLRLGKAFSAAGRQPLSSILDEADPSKLAKRLGGLAHRDRIVLAKAMLLGASTHHELSQAVKLQTGPLYHHLRELERTGILCRPDRNTYRLSEVGRIMLLVVSGLGTLEEEGGGRWKTKPWRDRSNPPKRQTGRSKRAKRPSGRKKSKVR